MQRCAAGGLGGATGVLQVLVASCAAAGGWHADCSSSCAAAPPAGSSYSCCAQAKQPCVLVCCLDGCLC
jgi:hypothetical protein